MLRTHPEYVVYDIDLSEAGAKKVDFQGDRLAITRMVTTSGALALDGTLRVGLGDPSEDKIALGVNSKIAAQAQRYYLEWDAQPGVTVTVVFSRASSEGGLAVDTPPAKQIVSQAKGSGVVTAAVPVGTSAVAVVAANGLRQSVIIQNLGSASVYVGGASVTTADGVEVAGGASLSLDGTTAALYAVASSSGQDVRVLEES